LRCLILAIDSLEYEIAKNYSNLTQEEFGRSIVPMTSDGEAYTPVVWGSFITGLTPEEHGIYEGPKLKWQNPMLERLKGFVKNSFFSRYSEGLGKFAAKMGFEQSRNHIFHTADDFKSKNISTIFDVAKKPVAMSIPSYNEEHENQHLRERLYDVYRNGLPEEVLEAEAREVFDNRAKRIFKILEEDWDLFMVHLFIVDTFGHLYPNRTSKFEELYSEMDDFVCQVKKKVDDTFVFVISDHGHRNGHHTSYGFYSSNEILGLHFPKITDFHDIILEVLSR
jgi:predicted AlkP superfamily phosphohydrolase/phosphomutase